MLEFFRTKIKDSIIFKGFLGLLTISFGIWGVGDFIGAGGLDPGIAVKIGKTEIHTDDFQRRFTQEMDRFRQSVGAEALQDDSIKRSVMNAVLQDVTRTATINAAAQSMGVVIPDSMLRDSIRSDKAFADASGKFSQSKFDQALAQNGLSEHTVVDMFADDLRQQTLMQPVSSNAEVPTPLTNALFSYRGETRSADTLLIPESAMTVAKPPTDDDLKALYTKDIATYTAPEYRKVSAAVLTAADLVNPASIDEAEVKTYYDQNQDRYRTPAKRHVEQLIFDSKEKADAARALAAPGDSLEMLAAKAKAGAVIDLGELQADSPIAKTIAAVFVLPEHEISQPVQTDLGWHLFEVTSLTPQSITPYDQVKDKVRQQVAAEKGTDAMYDASVKLEDAVAAGSPLADIAKETGARFISVDAMDRDGKDPTGKDVPDLIDRANFIRAAFSTTAGSDSDMKEVANRGGYYVIKVDAVISPKPKPLDQVRAQVVASWEKETRMTEAQALADKLVGDIGASTSMSALATSDKRLSYAPLGPITRFGQGLHRDNVVDSKRVSPEMLDHMFSAQTGGVFAAPVADGMLVARIQDITPAQPTGDLAALHEQLLTSLKSGVGTDLMEEMAQAFSSRYPIQVNDKVVDAMVHQAR